MCPSTGGTSCPGPTTADGCCPSTVPVTPLSAFDVCIVGAGPHGLAVLSALRAKQIGSNRPEPRVCVIDPIGVWMHEWDASFKALGISFLRSPAWAHPDACCQEAMVDFAKREGRTCDWKDVDFQGTSLEGMSKTAAGYYKNPSTKLFKDFCDDLISTLPHQLLRGSVVDIIKSSSATGGSSHTYEVMYESQAKAVCKISATHVVLALGARGCASVPAPFSSLMADYEGRVVHSSNVCRLESITSKLCTDDTMLIIGGGLSAAQVLTLHN